MQPSARILVALAAEDDRGVGGAIQEALERATYRVTRVAPTVADAVRSLNIEPPSLALVDIHLNDQGGGIEVAREAHSRGVPFIFVSAPCDPQTLQRAIELGPLSFIRKPFDTTHLVSTVARALSRCGIQDVPPPPTDATSSRPGTALKGQREWMFRELAKAALDPSSTYEPQPQLSRREFEVIRLLMGGRRVKSIAEELSLSPFTVRKYLGSVFRKLGVHSQEELLLALHNTAKGAPRASAK